MRLIYKPKAGFRGPGHGWPASDHDEANPKVAKEKVASKFYRKARPAKASRKRPAESESREEAKS